MTTVSISPYYYYYYYYYYYSDSGNRPYILLTSNSLWLNSTERDDVPPSGPQTWNTKLTKGVRSVLQLDDSNATPNLQSKPLSFPTERPCGAPLLAPHELALSKDDDSDETAEGDNPVYCLKAPSNVSKSGLCCCTPLYKAQSECGEEERRKRIRLSAMIMARLSICMHIRKGINRGMDLTCTSTLQHRQCWT